MKRISTALFIALALAGCARPDTAQQTTAQLSEIQLPAAPAPRAHFLKLIDRPKVEMNVKLQTPAVNGALEQTAFSFDAEKGQTVPGILLKTANSTGKKPVVIYLHGTGGKKEDGLALMRDVAGRGFVAVAIDGRYHGGRAAGTPKEGEMNAYETAIFHAWQKNEPHEHPLYYDTVWDIMRLIDYLQTREDVDGTRIGLYGVSKGGIEAYLAAAVDTRIAAVVPTISVESFKWVLDNNQWKPRVETFQKPFDAAAKEAGVATPDTEFVRKFYGRVMPGIDGEFDGPSMLPLIAPRPVMTINGERDPRTPPASLKLATDAAEAAYKAAKAEDRLVVMIQPNTPHQVRPEAQRAGIEFLVKWLKP